MAPVPPRVLLAIVGAGPTGVGLAVQIAELVTPRARPQLPEPRSGAGADRAAIAIGAAAIVGTLLIGTGFNVTVLVSMAFVFAASANFPPLILALTWRRFNTTGALTGVAFGIVASIVMIALSPPVWPGPDSEGAPSSLTFPGLVTIPIGFLGC